MNIDKQTSAVYALSGPHIINGVVDIKPSVGTNVTYNHTMVQRVFLEALTDMQQFNNADASVFEDMILQVMFGHLVCPCIIDCGPFYRSSNVQVDQETFQPVVNICVDYNIIPKDQGWNPGL